MRNRWTAETLEKRQLEIGGRDGTFEDDDMMDESSPRGGLCGLEEREMRFGGDELYYVFQ